MSEAQQVYLTHQLSLLPPEDRPLTVELTIHLSAAPSTIQIGYVVMETIGRHWVAAETPSKLVDLADLEAATDHIRAILTTVRGILSPFP